MSNENKNKDRELFLAKTLTQFRTREIAVCDNCEGYALAKHMHVYGGAIGQVCPECDLPPMWSSQFSRSKNNLRYYVFYNPEHSHMRMTKWGHPTKGNPLYIEGDAAQTIESCKRKR